MGLIGEHKEVQQAAGGVLLIRYYTTTLKCYRVML